jgi:hypothetical protein
MGAFRPLRVLLSAALLVAAALGAPGAARAANPVVTVTSLNPDSGVAITPCCGMGPCALFVQPTPFQMSCPLGTPVRLEAPATWGATPFTEWRQAGYAPNPYATMIITPDTNITLTAVYGNPVTSLPDFVVTGIVLTPASPISGTAFSAQVTVTNQGGAAQGVDPWLDVWNNSPGAPSCGTSGIAARSFGNLAAGASTVLTLTNLTAGAAGTATFRAFADSMCDVAESVETNNQATLTYTVLPRAVLSVSSVNPAGTVIDASPADLFGLAGAAAPFSRSYTPGTTVTLTAPATAGGNLFQKWQQDGLDIFTATPSISVAMNANHAITAIYAASKPDFYITDFALLPTQPVLGYPFRARVTIKNGGTVAGDAGYLSVWGDHLSSIACGTLDADVFEPIGVIGAGESRTLTVGTFPAPSTGNKYMRFFVDSLCQTAELDDANQSVLGYQVINHDAATLWVGSIDERQVTITHTMDLSGLAAGAPPFQSAYPTGTLVTLAAPAASPDGGVFQKWICDTYPWPTTPTVQVNMNSGKSCTAVYVGPGAPDFAITALTIDPASPPAGGTFSATVTVTNVGTGRGVPGVLMLFPDQPAALPCLAWSPYGPNRLWDLAAGQSVTRTIDNIPAGARGAKTLRAFIDDVCETDEPDEANNQATLAYDVVNSPPQLAAIGNRSVAEGATLGFTIAATDANGDALSYAASNLPAGASFDPATRTFSWSPGYDRAGSYPGVRFEVSDGVATVFEEIQITVTPTNRAPRLEAIGSRSVAEGATLSFTIAAADDDGDELSYAASSLPSGASFDPATRTFSWTPGYDRAGSYPGVRFQVSDGAATVFEEIQITVTPTNRAPKLEAIGSRSVAEGATLAFTVAAADDDGDALSYAASNLPPGSSFTPATRTFSWSPGYDRAGDYPGVRFQVSDGAATVFEEIQITVTPTNRAPKLEAIGSRSVVEGATLAFTVAATDDDGDALTYAASNLPDGATFDPATRVFSWSPGVGRAGSYPGVRFEVSDGAATVAEEITITVTPGNRAPVLDPTADQEVGEGQLLTFSVGATDPDGDTLAYGIFNAPAGSTFDPATGLFSWRPRFDQGGSYPGIRFTVADPGGLGDEAEIAITVTESAAPIFTDPFTHGTAAGDPDWTKVSGKWAGGGGLWTALSTTATNIARITLLDPAALPVGAGIVQARVRLTAVAAAAAAGGGPNAMIVFGYSDPAHYRWVRITPARIQIGQTGSIDGIAAGIKKSVVKGQAVGTWHTFTVKTYPDGWVRVYRDTATTPAAAWLFSGAAGPSVVPGGVGLASTKAKAVFDNVTVWDDAALALP